MKNIRRALFAIAISSPFASSDALATECTEIRECMDAMVEIALDLAKQQQALEKKIAELEKEMIARDNEILQKYKKLLVQSFSNFKIGELKKVGSGKCEDGMVIVAVPHQIADTPMTSTGRLRRMQPTCAKLIIDVDE